MFHRTQLFSSSGVIPLPIYTKPYDCGGDCIFCPKEGDLPRSYVKNEDTLFAQVNYFSPSKQFYNHLSKTRKKHNFDKHPFEIIILGGSFSFLPKSYRECFLTKLYNAMANHKNTYKDTKRWESGRYRCSVLTVESRPDQISNEECRFLRYLGVSKVELGVTHTDNSVLAFNNKGYGLDTIKRATRILKNNGFKVGYHIMLGLPGSSYSIDRRMVEKTLWENSIIPDYLKIYPCLLLKNDNLQKRLHVLYDNGTWKPISKKNAAELINFAIKNIPRFTRISRMQRMFPTSIIAAGPKFTRKELANTHTMCNCIRCREIGLKDEDLPIEKVKIVDFRHQTYTNNINIEVVGDNEYLIAIARLYQSNENTYILRELRVYGKASKIGYSGLVQGKGIGSLTLSYAENLIKERGGKKLLINVPFGARSFFRQKNYIQNSDHYFKKFIN